MRKTFWTGLICTVVASGMWALSAVGHDEPADPHAGHDAPAVHEGHHAMAPATQPSELSTKLASLKPALDDLGKAVNAGDKDAALAKLKAVRELVRQATVPADGFANTYCPIMGGPFDPTSISPDLTRQWHGQKVGFCCGGCPEAWDKLSDAQKQAKLDAAGAGK